jgi:hypothetical protein
MADDPELTDGDYPSEKTLKRIKKAKPREALELAQRAWHWDGWATRELRPDELAMVRRHYEDDPMPDYYRFATGGWSGNEDIIEALDRNFLVLGMCWVLSARGGLHIYEVRKEPKRGRSQRTPPGKRSTRVKASSSNRRGVPGVVNR